MRDLMKTLAPLAPLLVAVASACDNATNQTYSGPALATVHGTMSVKQLAVPQLRLICLQASSPSAHGSANLLVPFESIFTWTSRQCLLSKLIGRLIVDCQRQSVKNHRLIQIQTNFLNAMECL